jgi:hypothetical protein
MISEYTRGWVVGLWRQGNTNETIAGITGLTIEQVEHIIETYKLNLSLYDQRN